MQEERTENSTVILHSSSSADFTGHQENDGLKGKRIKSDLHAYGGNSKHLWTNLSHIFSRTCNESSITDDPSKMGMVKSNSASSKRFCSLLKHHKTTNNPVARSITPIQPLCSSAVSETTSPQDDNKSLTLAVRLPSGITTENLSFTIELEAARTDEKSSSQLNLNEENVMALRCCEETETTTVFSGIIKVPPNTNVAKLANIPLYIMDSKEEVMLSPSSEMTYRTIIRPSARIMNEEQDSDIIVGDVKIKLKLAKTYIKPKKSRFKSLRRSKNNKIDNNHASSSSTESASDASYKVLLLSNSSHFEELPMTLEKEPTSPKQYSCLEIKDSCGLNEKHSFCSLLSDYEEEILNKIKVERFSDGCLEKSLVMEKNPSKWSTPTEPFRTVATQYSATNFTATKGTDVQDSFISPLFRLFNEPHTLETTTAANSVARRNLACSDSPNLETTSAETVWPQSHTTSITTGHSSTLLSYPFDVSENDATASNYYQSQNYLMNSKSLQTESLPFKKKIKTVDVGIMVDRSGTCSTETRASNTTLNLLKGAKYKLKSYLSNEVSSGCLFKEEDLNSRNSNPWRTTKVEQSNCMRCNVNEQITDYSLNDNYEFYQKIRHTDALRYFEEVDSILSIGNERLRNCDSYLSGDNFRADTMTFQTYPLMVTQTPLVPKRDNEGNWHTIETLRKIKTKLDTEIDNMETLYKEVFDGVDKILDFDEMLSDETINEKGSNEIEEMNKDLNQTFGELKTCLSQMSQILNKTYSSRVGFETKIQEGVQNPSQSHSKGLETEVSSQKQPTTEANQTFLTKRHHSYLTLEHEIDHAINELLKESEGIKETAIMNGVKEEREPPFSIELLPASKNTSDPYVICLNIVDEIVNVSEKIVSARDALGDANTLEDDIKNILNTLLDNANDTIMKNCKKKTCNFHTGDTTNRNEDELQIKKPTIYFCNVKGLSPKIPKTSYSFGEGRLRDKRMINLNSKSPARRRDGLNAHGAENSRIIEELRNLEGLSEGAAAALKHNNGEGNENDKPKNNPSSNPTSSVSPANTSGIRKSAKNLELPAASRNDNSLPLHRDDLYTVTVTDNEEQVIGTMNLEDPNKTTGEDSEYFVPARPSAYSKKSGVSQNLRKRAINPSREISSSDEELASTSSYRRPIKKAKEESIMVIKPNISMESSSETCEFMMETRQFSDEEEQDDVVSYIGLRAAPGTPNIPRGLNEHTEEPGRNPSVIDNPRPLELLQHEVYMSNLSCNREQVSDREYEADMETLQVKLPRTKYRYKSIHELNNPDEIAAIEKNVKENDQLERETMMVLCQSEQYSSGYEEDSSSYCLEFESESEMSMYNTPQSSTLINVINIEEVSTSTSVVNSKIEPSGSR